MENLKPRIGCYLQNHNLRKILATFLLFFDIFITNLMSDLPIQHTSKSNSTNKFT